MLTAKDVATDYHFSQRKQKIKVPWTTQAGAHWGRAARWWAADGAPHLPRSHTRSGCPLAKAAPSAGAPAPLQGAKQTRPSGPPVEEMQGWVSGWSGQVGVDFVEQVRVFDWVRCGGEVSRGGLVRWKREKRRFMRKAERKRARNRVWQSIDGKREMLYGEVKRERKGRGMQWEIVVQRK